MRPASAAARASAVAAAAPCARIASTRANTSPAARPAVPLPAAATELDSEVSPSSPT